MNTGYPVTFFMALGCRRLARAAAKLVAVVAGAVSAENALSLCQVSRS